MSGAARSWVRVDEQGFHPCESIPLSDRGFRYGMAIFETIGVRHGRPLFMAEHLQSASEACRAMALQVAEEWFIQASELMPTVLEEGFCGVLRLHVTAGDGAPDAPATACRMFLTREERPALAPAAYARGYRLLGLPGGRNGCFASFKTHNYWSNTEALAQAKKAGADEGLLFDAKERLLSACMANVFVVTSSGDLVTPPQGQGVRAGVVRRWVLARRNVQEVRLRRSDLREAQEIFLTNSWLGVMPVTNVDGRDFNEMAVSNLLQQDYHCHLDTASDFAR